MSTRDDEQLADHMPKLEKNNEVTGDKDSEEDEDT